MKMRIGIRETDNLPLQMRITDSPSGNRIKRPNPDGIKAVNVKMLEGPKKNRRERGYCYISAIKNHDWAKLKWPDAKSVKIQAGCLGIMGSDVLHWINGLPTHKAARDFLPFDPWTGSNVIDAHYWVEVLTKDNEKIVIDPTHKEHKEFAKGETILLNYSGFRAPKLRSGMKRDWYQPVYLPAKRKVQYAMATSLAERAAEVKVDKTTSKQSIESIKSKILLLEYYSTA